MPIYDAPLARSEPFRIGVRPLLVAGFSGLILIALSGATVPRLNRSSCPREFPIS